jgi:hypothetical protein
VSDHEIFKGVPLISSATPESTSQAALDKSTFPTEWFEFDKATNRLYLKSGYSFIMSGGTLTVTGAANVTGSLDVDANLNVDGTGHVTGALDTDASLTVDGQATVGAATTILDHWFDVVNPAVGWFASLSTGWSADTWRTIDFSAVVTAGTKKVKVAAYFTQSAGYLWFNRKYADSNISNTPNAATEYAKIIGMAASGTNYQADVWELELDANYKTDIACGTASAVLYLSYPKSELRNL